MSDKMRISFNEFLGLVYDRPEIPPGTTLNKIMDLLSESYECEQNELPDRNYNSLYDFDSNVMPILRSRRYQL